MRGCACQTSKIWLSLYQFFVEFPTLQYTVFKKKTPTFDQIGCFYNNLPKIHPFYVIWAPSALMKTPPIAIPNFAKKCPKRQAHIRIPCQCENPPGNIRYIETSPLCFPTHCLLAFVYKSKLCERFSQTYKFLGVTQASMSPRRTEWTLRCGKLHTFFP